MKEDWRIIIKTLLIPAGFASLGYALAVYSRSLSQVFICVGAGLLIVVILL